MSEYGSNWDDNDKFYEIDKEMDEDKNDKTNSEIDEEIEEDLDEKWDPDENNEDFFKEYEQWDPNIEIEYIFKEYEQKDPNIDLKNDVPEEIHQENTADVKKIDIIEEILNENNSTIPNFNEYLRDELYKSDRIGLSEKSTIIRTTQNESLTGEEKKELQLILGKLSIKELEEYKNKIIEDYLMFDEEYDENLDDLKNFKENFDDKELIEGIKDEEVEETDDKEDDLSWLKDYDDNSEERHLDDLSWLKEYDENIKDNKLVSDKDKVFGERIEEEYQGELKHNYDEKKEFIVNKEMINEEQQEYKQQDEIKEYNYKNLMNPIVKEKFREYNNETSRDPNLGTRVRKDFFNWIDEKLKNERITEETKENLEKIRDICHNINNNQEIQKLIIEKIQNTNLSQTKISTLTNEFGIHVNRKKIGEISLKEVYNNDIEAHKERFMKVPIEIQQKIIERLENEVKKENHDSLYKIQKDFPEVSKSYIDKLAQKTFPQDIFQKTWPSTQTGSKENIIEILEREATKENPESLRSIAKEANASATFVNDVAKEIYPDKHQEIWPAIEKIPEETKNEIINTIKEEAQKENPKTLKEIHKEFTEVGSDTIKRLAKQVVPKEIHDKVWQPLTVEMPQEVILKIKNIIKSELRNRNPRSLNEIAKEVSVSCDSVSKIAKNIVNQEVYEKIWPFHEQLSEELKKTIVQDIREKINLNIQEIASLHGVSSPTVSQISQDLVFKGDIDAHRERFPFDQSLELGTYNHLNINAIVTNAIHESYNQKYYSEPNIYPDKRKPDGLILENNNFLHDRLTNPKNGQYLSEMLKIDSKKLDHIKATQVDFTNNISDENIVNKIEKYQSKDTLLMIVGTRWYPYKETKPLPEDSSIKYPENIKIISHDLFADFINLESENRDSYNKVIDLNYDHDLNSLKAFFNYDLSFINTHDTRELKEDLMQTGLIKENFDEYFDFEVLNNKNDNRKQINLDYFLYP